MNSHRYYFSMPFLVMLIVLFVTYFIQTKILFSGDVGYLLHVTNQMLNGAHYGYEIFETNPPMILYLYLPVVLLKKIIAMNIMTLLRFYVLFLACASVSICYYLIKKLLKPEDIRIAYSLYFALIFIEFFLPADEFGQREHLLLILTLPYFFSSVLFIENKKIAMKLKLLIGLAAGFGFALKPFFLAPLILTELYIMFKRHSFFAWMRVESIAILLVLVAYLITAFLLQPGYFHIVLPLVTYFYFIGVQNDWFIMLANDVTLLAIVCFMFWYWIKNEDSYRSLSTILFLTTIGMIIAFLIPRTYWYYQVIPSLSFAILFVAYTYGMLIKKPINGNAHLFLYRVVLFVCCIAVLYFPLTHLFIRYYYLGFNKDFLTSRKIITEQVNNMKDVHKIFCFSVNTTRDCFPLVYDTDKRFTGSFPFYWWLRGMLVWDHLKDKNQSVTAKNKKILIDKAADDLNRYQPDLILVNDKRIKYVVENEKFNLISYLSENKEFRNAWKHYHYLSDVGSYVVYKRNDRELSQ